MLCVGPELAMEMTTMSPMRRAASFRVPPGWSGDCPPVGAALLLAGDDMRISVSGCSARGGYRLASRAKGRFARYAGDPRATSGRQAISKHRYPVTRIVRGPQRRR